VCILVLWLMLGVHTRIGVNFKVCILVLWVMLGVHTRIVVNFRYILVLGVNVRCTYSY